MNDEWMAATRKAMTMSGALIEAQRTNDETLSAYNDFVAVELRRGMMLLLDSDWALRKVGCAIIDGLWKEPLVVRAIAGVA